MPLLNLYSFIYLFFVYIFGKDDYIIKKNKKRERELDQLSQAENFSIWTPLSKAANGSVQGSIEVNS